MRSLPSLPRAQTLQGLRPLTAVAVQLAQNVNGRCGGPGLIICFHAGHSSDVGYFNPIYCRLSLGIDSDFFCGNRRKRKKCEKSPERPLRRPEPAKGLRPFIFRSNVRTLPQMVRTWHLCPCSPSGVEVSEAKPRSRVEGSESGSFRAGARAFPLSFIPTFCRPKSRQKAFGL